MTNYKPTNWATVHTVVLGTVVVTGFDLCFKCNTLFNQETDSADTVHDSFKTHMLTVHGWTDGT